MAGGKRYAKFLSEVGSQESEVKIPFLKCLPFFSDQVLTQQDAYPRIICNYYQPGSKDIAGDRFCQWLKNTHNIWKWMPFLLFNEEYKGSVTIKQSMKYGIWVTGVLEELMLFCSSPLHTLKKFPVPPAQTQ